VREVDRGGSVKRLPGVSAELAAACRAVAAAYERLPEAARPEVGWDDVDAEVDAACAGGNRDQAHEAIRTWRDRYLRLFREVGW